MKAIDKYLIYILLAAVLGLYILHFTSSNTPEPVEEVVADTLKTEPKGEKTGRMYYVNTDSVWGKYKYVMEVTERLEKTKSQYENQMEKQLRDFEREVTEFREKAPFMSEVEAQIKQKELMRKEKELGQLSEQLELKFMKQEKEWNDKLRNKIVDLIDQKTIDLSYDFILGYSISSNIILANDSLDLTDEILEALNNDYDTEFTTE